MSTTAAGSGETANSKPNSNKNKNKSKNENYFQFFDIESGKGIFKKSEELSENAPKYFYGGHGGDYCHPIKKKIVTETVPENCIYITAAICGLPTYGIQSKMDLIYSDDSEIKKALKFPYKRGMKAKIANIIGVNTNDIHVHLPGTDYTVSEFQPIGYFLLDDRVEFYISGLLQIHDWNEPSHVPPVYKSPLDPNFPFNLSLFLKYYNDSVFPTQEQMTKICYDVLGDDIKKVGKDDKILVSDFFKKYHDLIKKINELSQKDKNVKNPYPFLSNTYLMKKYPGIHFFLICREVPEDCMPATSARRTISRYQQEDLNTIANRINGIKNTNTNQINIQETILRDPFNDLFSDNNNTKQENTNTNQINIQESIVRDPFNDLFSDNNNIKQENTNTNQTNNNGKVYKDPFNDLFSENNNMKEENKKSNTRRRKRKNRRISRKQRKNITSS